MRLPITKTASAPRNVAGFKSRAGGALEPLELLALELRRVGVVLAAIEARAYR
jgi:hypothetical protein